MTARRRTTWAGALLAGAALACGRGHPRAPTPEGFGPIATPAADHGAVCADVGTLRACWAADGTPSLVARTLPAMPAASPLGWRCAWPGPTRLCVDRRADAAAFTCAGERCTQSHPRRPDDGEWTCVDSAGAVVCVGGQRAAGVVAGAPDVAWICGQRPEQRPRDAYGSRVCVDFAPDFPDGDGTHWRCRSVNGPAGARVCERGTDVAVLGVRCDRARPCVDGAACVGAECVPARPAPSCWLDDDCPSGACRFGTCRAAGAP